MSDEKAVPQEEVKEETQEATTEETTETKVEEPQEEVQEEATEEVVEEVVESKEEVKTGLPDLKPGMTVRIYQKIKELNSKGEEKERIQYFEGMIIAKKHNKEIGATITVRKVSNGVGVEKIFPLNLPTIDRIEVKKIARVRRAKLFFLRKGYKKRLKEQVVKS